MMSADRSSSSRKMHKEGAQRKVRALMLGLILRTNLIV